MGFAMPAGQSFIKGPACQCLDMLHRDLATMNALDAALMGITLANPGGLEAILENNLLNLKYDGSTTPSLSFVVSHLKNRWFGSDTKQLYFSTNLAPVIYAAGLRRAIALSKGDESKDPLPIDSYWVVVDHTKFEMIVANDPNGVLLLIVTERPGKPYP